MPNRNYEAGRRFEYARRDHWKKEGYEVMRTAGSHGPFDLICVPIDTNRPVKLIQCKRIKDGNGAGMVEAFLQSPPLPPGRHFRQTIEVWSSKTKEFWSGTV